VACAVILPVRSREHFEPAHGRHSDVAQNHVGLERVDLLQALPAA
jgi:hypothetical protein